MGCVVQLISLTARTSRSFFCVSFLVATDTAQAAAIILFLCCVFFYIGSLIWIPVINKLAFLVSHNILNNLVHHPETLS